MTLNSENLFLYRAKFIMKALGLWVPTKDESFLYKIYRVFIMTSQYLCLIFQTIHIAQVWGDLEAVSQACYITFTQACLCFKVTVFLVNMDLFKQLLTQMNADIFKPQSIEHEKILSYHAARIKRFLLAFMLTSQTTCALWALKPLLDDKGTRNFPLEMWMPVTPDKSPQYELGYLSQFLTISISAFIYFGVDSVPFSMIIFGCAQMDIVKNKIISVSSIYDAKENERSKLSRNNYKKLIECVLQHQAVVSLAQLTENAYHTYLFFQLAGTIGIFCMSALRMTVIDWQSTQFFSIASYLIVMTCQLFICCWSGHELTAISEDLHTVMYMCIWYEQDLKFKRDLCFAMMRMSRPIVFRAGHYVKLSRETFIAILRMSYSYFAVLNQTSKN
ncbi:odorant receptor Or1-like [Galleria mellonella]|uniref:Odorant receptor n=1 Tax=Galleria mellonella TaxID=7137 RepID=A0ABM3MZ99_GALME|nr:odorant receptor Or1-like [Galleria mellonella]